MVSAMHLYTLCFTRIHENGVGVVFSRSSAPDCEELFAMGHFQEALLGSWSFLLAFARLLAIWRHYYTVFWRVLAFISRSASPAETS
jgi:hypothetical protein